MIPHEFRAEKIIIEANLFADYVFEKDYDLYAAGPTPGIYQN